MRDVWDDEKRRQSASRLSGAVRAGGANPHSVVRKEPTGFYGFYKNTGSQGALYQRRSNMPQRGDTSGIAELKDTIDRIETELIEAGEQIIAIAELSLETIADVSYDAAKGEVVVHADRDYSIPLALEGVDMGRLAWSYNNGVLEILFDKEKGQ